MSSPATDKPEGEAGNAQACQHHADAVERLLMFRRHRIDVERHQHDADQADRND